MIKNLIEYILYALAIFFCFSMFFTILWTPIIGELDDVRMVQFIGLPIAFTSTAIGVIISRIGSYRFSSVVLLVNSLCILPGILGTYEGVIDFITFNMHSYHGHQGNDYTSTDLLIISLSCLFLLCINVIFYLKNRSNLNRIKLNKNIT